MLLQIATAFSLQSAIDLLQITTGITKCDDYYNCESTPLHSEFSLALREGEGGMDIFWNYTLPISCNLPNLLDSVYYNL